MINEQLAEVYESEGYVNRELSPKEIIKYLDDHGNDWHVQVSTGKLFASDMCVKTENGEIVDCAEFVDTTDWQLFDLLAHLQY